jgi:glycosyltransferase involved in cell wall biosynthesis
MALQVAHFIQRYPPALGGSEAYFERLGKYLADQGDRVTVFTTTADSLEAFWSPSAACFAEGTSVFDNIEVRRYRPHLQFRGRRWLLKPLSWIPHRDWQCLTISCNPFAFGMWRAARQTGERFDVVHASAFPYAFPILCARQLARRLGVPFLLTPFLHLGDPSDPRDATRRGYTSPALMALAREADFVFAQTPGERAALVAHGVLADRIVLQGLGVDLTACTGGDRRRARQAWGVSEDEIVIGHLANNSVEKGTVDLLQAAALLWQDGLRFRMVLAGPEMHNFQHYWQRFPKSACVVRLGPLTDMQKRDFFAAIDAFVLPSRSDSFGLVLLEAWANRLPNLAYKAGGIADIIKDGSDGILTPCGDVPTLARALQSLVSDPDLRRRLGTTGWRRVKSEFQWPEKLAIVRRTIDQGDSLTFTKNCGCPSGSVDCCN